MPIEAQGALNNLDALARSVSTLQNQMAPIALAYQGAWDNRALPSQSNIGMLWRITDVGVGGGSWWWSDGTNLRPLNGRVLLWQRNSLFSSPLSTITANATNKDFLLPDNLAFPAGMLYPGISVWASASIRRNAIVGSAGSTTVKFGTNATTPNNNVLNVFSQSAANDWNCFGGAKIVSSTSYLSAAGNTSLNSVGVSAISDKTTLFDTSVVNYLSFGISSGVTIDQFSLAAYSVWLEG